MDPGPLGDEDDKAKGLEDDEMEDEGQRERPRSGFEDEMAVDDDEEDAGAKEEKQRRRSGSEFFELGNAANDEVMQDAEDGDDFINHLCSALSLLDETEVERQALLPSVNDPKLWPVECAVGNERAVAIRLAKKFICRPDLQIKSAVALDYLLGYILVEADEAADVRKACSNLGSVLSVSARPVPIEDMIFVLSAEGKTADLSRGTWVRMELGLYKGDLAKVVDVDNVRKQVTVKLIPKTYLLEIADKLEGSNLRQKALSTPTYYSVIADEERAMHITTQRRRKIGGVMCFENVSHMILKDGFLYEPVSIKSVSSQNARPTVDELQKFQKLGDGNGDVASLSILASFKKCEHFLEGTEKAVVRGDFRITYFIPWLYRCKIDPYERHKYFQPGDHVKVVSGVQKGAIGRVVKAGGDILTVLLDTMQKNTLAFLDDIEEFYEVTDGDADEGNWCLPDIMVNLHRPGEKVHVGVIREVPTDCLCKVEVALGSAAETTEMVTALGSELEKVMPQKFDRIKIIKGFCKGKTGQVLGFDGSDVIVKMDYTLQVKIFEISALAKLMTV